MIIARQKLANAPTEKQADQGTAREHLKIRQLGRARTMLKTFTQHELDRYEKDGYLMLPDLLSRAEIAHLAAEVSRVSLRDSPEILREKSGAIRTISGMHDRESGTYSPAFESLVRLPSLLGRAEQILGTDDLYVFHTKCNVKEAIDGALYQWHQDYAFWNRDGVPAPALTTALIMLDDASEIGGSLYFVPGSHRAGLLPTVMDKETTSYETWTIKKNDLIEVMKKSPEPAPIVGKCGAVVFFHPNIVHGSGHNMSSSPRWHAYVVYNKLTNKPSDSAPKRPQWIVSRKFDRLTRGDDRILS